MPEPMTHQTPESSMMHRIEYHPKEKVLRLHVRQGKAISLTGVPEEHFHVMKAAASAGKYYHSNLKGKFSEA